MSDQQKGVNCHLDIIGEKGYRWDNWHEIETANEYVKDAKIFVSVILYVYTYQTHYMHQLLFPW